MGSARAVRVLRFGAFEVDLRTGELRKQGRKIKLQEQPFQILAALVKRPREVVARDELRKRLWPDNTFVDFDHSLNTAIMRLREALGDTAANSVFIETLPRRGYRFIAPVEELSGRGAEETPPWRPLPIVGSGVTLEETVTQTQASPVRRIVLMRTRNSGLRTKLTLASLVTALLTLFTVFAARSVRKPARVGESAQRPIQSLAV